MDKTRFIFILQFICLLAGSAFWFISYLDQINMINNGYLNKDSLSFRTKGWEGELNKHTTNYILMQYDTISPNFKYVHVKGHVKLPPIDYISGMSTTGRTKYAIIGKMVRTTANIPKSYEIIGYFDTPHSYRLQFQTWLISKEASIDLTNGTSFDFSTPNGNARKVLDSLIDSEKVELIPRDQFGTYVLESNRMFPALLAASLFFLFIMKVMMIYMWIRKDNAVIKVLYLSGNTYWRIAGFLAQQKLLPYILGSGGLIILLFTFKFMNPLWDNVWLNKLMYFVIAGWLVLLIIIGFTIIKESVQKGGKRF
ncbi:hypothetical protein [Paenibacillus pinihumi]|uniref:hypothetical protein n=1 Tax=Paenibacillus pinihumi TaxID=669462 RepID=UPI0004247B7F|nr:hypothetical protein [Paenibacillus pinihumi]